MVNLFNETTYLDYTFPQPQYLGAKYKFIDWISSFLPNNINNVLDAFSGSQSVSFRFKQFGYKVITNDFLNFNHQIGISLIENKNNILTDIDLDILFDKNSNETFFNLFQNVYTNVFFDINETLFLDSFRSNIDRLENRYKKSLALSIMNRSMTRKVTMGHFCHAQALNYASNPDRIKRNRSLIRPIKDIFIDLLKDYNASVFDNKKDNISYNCDILELLPNLDDIDLVYFDPPYCNSHADYQSFYHVLETYTEYWKDKEFINSTKRYEPKKYTGFDKKNNVIESLNLLFEFSKDIPYWLFSYNDRSYPDENTIVDMISKYKKNVDVYYNKYRNGVGGKGSVAGSHEILIVASSK